MTTWTLIPGGYAVREVPPNAVEMFLGEQLVFNLRHPDGRITAAASVGGLIVCSCRDWGCVCDFVVSSHLEALHQVADAPTPPEAA